MITVGDPKIIKSILVKDFNIFHNRSPLKLKHEILSKNLFNSTDDDWKRYRSIISPTFTSGKMKRMYPLIDHCHKYCIDNLESHVINKKYVNLKDVFGCFTMDVIAKCAFGTETNANEDKNNPFVVNGRKVFSFPLRMVILMIILPAFLLKLIGYKMSFIDEEGSQFFINVAKHIVRKRRQNNEKHNDFLQLLMDCQSSDSNEIDNSESHHINEGEDEINANKQALNINISKKKLEEDEILAQAWIFFVAGYETTATTLSFCIYELAINQQMQDKLYEEVKSNADENGNIDYEKLTKLPYLDAVIAETLRKYPPVLRLERHASQNYVIPEINIPIVKDTIVEIPVYAIHHCEEFYPNPEKFYPDRFLPENRHLIQPYTYLPFGAGPRNCIGMRFGLLEAKFGLFKIIEKFKFFKCPETDVPAQMLFLRRIIGAKRLIVSVDYR